VTTSNPETGLTEDGSVVYACSGCSDFKLSKRYTGISGTKAEHEYEAIKPSEKYPICGGGVQKGAVSK
jgi:hypothetical protein